MKRRLTIGLMGLSFGSENLGCVALAISFYRGLVQCLKEQNLEANILAISLSARNPYYIDEQYPIVFQEYHLSDFKSYYNSKKLLRSCDIVFDFTEGDSFADIYGRARFYRSIMLKLAIEHVGIPLVLGPQTYGPFERLDCREIAKVIIKKAYKVYSRDEMSKEYIKKIGVKRDITLSTDVAFRLPSEGTVIPKSKMINVGINVSGLLWDDDRVGKNSLGLSVRYTKYCESVIERLLSTPKYRVHLIPHTGTCADGIESDYGACYELSKKYPKCKLYNGVEDPIEVKNTLSQMDIVIAARMHASIAAFSSGVLTIPFSYSRKFQGYYGQLDYPILIDGKTESTERAVQKTLDFIETFEKFGPQIKRSHNIAQSMLTSFYEDVSTIISDIAGEMN